jgi:phage replication-related protein YjqB (UPF0714/DUF867 family)
MLVETPYLQTQPPAEGLMEAGPMNICNRGKSRQGVQLEVNREIRVLLRNDEDRLLVFVEAMRKAIQRKEW